MRALKLESPGVAAVTSTPIPPLRSPTDLLIKTSAVALNPTDWKHMEWASGSTTMGCDFSGTIVSLGSSVNSSFKEGDRVFGAVHGSNVLGHDDGAFAEYVLCDENLCMRVPEGMGFEEAATLGVGVATVGQGMYQKMGLPWPRSEESENVEENSMGAILIYGGSSAMGAYGIQFAKLSGFEVITTCSPRNFEYVKSLGADLILDYKSPTCAAEIRKHTQGKLYYAWDTISEPSSAQICADALAVSEPGGQMLHYGALVPVTFPREDVETSFSAVYSAIGKAWQMRELSVPARREDYEFMAKWVRTAEALLAQGKVRAHRPEVRDGGLEGILEGLEDLKNGKVSGVKLVYKV
ncbi:oxidoreductase-like protein [Clohesyomyces aquaticus]|uniref:Oxidoreductase-like protein n=1 Tax=Clohesyomyces aquaticus TaxID=1231657 RepID=A0A1Y1YXB1_9PLEO|nr:oxidoreductase-like protein [Clohesyomyces aquaticus]